MRAILDCLSFWIQRSAKDSAGFGSAKAQKEKKCINKICSPCRGWISVCIIFGENPAPHKSPSYFLFFHVLFLTTKKYLNCSMQQWINNSFPWDELLWLDDWTQIFVILEWQEHINSLLAHDHSFRPYQKFISRGWGTCCFFSVSCRHTIEAGYRWIMDGLWQRWVVWLRFDTLLCFLLKHISNKMQRGIYISWEFDPGTLQLFVETLPSYK